MATFRTTAIVLNKTRLNEADRLYVLYTPEHGKIEARVRSAAKSKSKIAGSIEPISLAEVMIAKGKFYDIVAGAQLIKRYQFDDWRIFQQVAITREIFCRIIKPGLSDESMYQKLFGYLETIEKNHQSAVSRLLTQRFIWQSLNLLGLAAKSKMKQPPEPELLTYFLGNKKGHFAFTENVLKELEIFTRQYFFNITESDLKSFSLS